MLKNPDTIPYIRQHIRAEDLILPEMQEACRAIWQCADSGAPINLTSIGPLVSEGVVPQLSMVLAQNIDLTPPGETSTCTWNASARPHPKAPRRARPATMNSDGCLTPS